MQGWSRSVSCTARKQEGAITARWTGIACRSLMSAQEASRGMRSTPPRALTLNTLTLNNHPRTVRQAAWAEPTAKLSANQRPPALHHSTTLCNSQLATADTRASTSNCILRAPPPLDSHATGRETLLLLSSRAADWCSLLYEYVQVMYSNSLPLPCQDARDSCFASPGETDRGLDERQGRPRLVPSRRLRRSTPSFLCKLGLS